MNPVFKRTAIAMLLAPALALTAYAQDRQQAQNRSQQQSDMYRNAWSAEEMLDTDVRAENGDEIGEVKDIIVGRSGNISKLVVEVGGLLEIGDQHIGVPWKDVKIGRGMEWVQVPLREVQDGSYSLYGDVPQGEEVSAAESAWRVRELLGDYASLEDVPRYGLVTDVIFDARGKAQHVVVDRRVGAWGPAGWYAYPYGGYPDTYAYGLPYDSSEVQELEPFDYAQLAGQSDYAGASAGAGASRQGNAGEQPR